MFAGRFAAVLILAALALTAYLALFLHVESEVGIGLLLVLAMIATVLIKRLGYDRTLEQAGRECPQLARGCALAGMLALIVLFHEMHFTLLMLCTVLLYVTACLGVTVQLGFAGVANFSAAAFFGMGAYATAVLTTHTALPHLLIIVCSGLVAALVGSLLITPVLRTRGHYAALVTIAFGILFKTFIEVNDVLGGPQGLQVPGLQILGLDFNAGYSVLGYEVSFYVNYAVLSLLLCAATYLLVQTLERSWVGLSMDIVRTDETAATTFGLHIARWKIVAFMMGNFFAGVAGSVYGALTAFIAPNNFTFADSLLMLSIVILGGLGNALGLLPAAIIVLMLPEKLQFIQEYRFLLYALLVIAILRFRPHGLLPRATRVFFAERQR